MMNGSSILRRTYDGIVLFALLNMLGLGALVAVLVSSGAVDAEKVRTIVSILRGEDTAAALEQPDDSTVVAEEPAEPAVGADAIAEAQRSAQIARLESDRIKAELDQRLALNNSILLRVTTERERFWKEREAAQKKEALSKKRRRDTGFRKQLDIIEALKPKVAVEHLLALPDADEASRILLQMDTRKAKKIVEAAKTPGQLSRMKVILQRVREVAPDRSDELDPTAP